MAKKGFFQRIKEALFGAPTPPAPTPPPAQPVQPQVVRSVYTPVTLDGVEIGPSLLPLDGRVGLDRHHRYGFTAFNFEYQGLVEIEDGAFVNEVYTTWLGYDRRPTNRQLAEDIIQNIGMIMAGAALGSQQLRGRVTGVSLGRAARG